jgi:glutamate synthase (NADPH/NADH) small chain
MARIFKSSSAHEEGGERRFSTETLSFEGTTKVTSISLSDHVSGEVVSLHADLVLIAAGFVGPELEHIGLRQESFMTPRDTIKVDSAWRVEGLGSGSGVFACGDAVRGQSLIVWAIAEGRSVASAVDAYLLHAPSTLPAPVEPYSLSW